MSTCYVGRGHSTNTNQISPSESCYGSRFASTVSCTTRHRLFNIELSDGLISFNETDLSKIFFLLNGLLLLNMFVLCVQCSAEQCTVTTNNNIVETAVTCDRDIETGIVYKSIDNRKEWIQNRTDPSCSKGIRPTNPVISAT